MSQNLSAPSTSSGATPKRWLKILTIVEKVKLLDILKERSSCTIVGHHYGINEFMVRYIKKVEKKIRATAAVSYNQGAKRVISGCNKAVVWMESALGLWIEDCRKKNIPMDTHIIREKAKQLHEMFVDSGDELEDDPSAVDKAVRLAKQLGGEGFDDMTSYDIIELLKVYSNPLTDEDLAKRTKSASEEEKEQDEDREHEEEEEQGLTLKHLATILRLSKELKSSVEEWDPQMIRSLQFRNALDGAMEVYENLLTQMKRQRQQLPITMFFTRKK